RPWRIEFEGQPVLGGSQRRGERGWIGANVVRPEHAVPHSELHGSFQPRLGDKKQHRAEWGIAVPRMTVGYDPALPHLRVFRNYRWLRAAAGQRLQVTAERPDLWFHLSHGGLKRAAFVELHVLS